MRIGIIAPAPVPAVLGGAERLWQGLRDGLLANGHQVEMVTIDFLETTFREVIAGYRRFSQLDVSRFDLTISGKYPAWMIQHPRHIVYQLHPLRGLYDTYPAHLEEFDGPPDVGQCTDVDALLTLVENELDKPDSDDALHAYPGPFARAVVQRLDELAFAGDRVAAFAAISEEVAGRDGYLPPERPVLVSYPESSVEDTKTTTQEPGGAEGALFFTASRLDHPKRIDLLIRAFQSLPTLTATLRIAGTGPQLDALKQLAGTDYRIEFVGRVSDAELARNYANATAVVFVPDNEDFGYISLEAMLAGTPVITTTDSGGANELLSEGVGGLVVAPTPKAIAAAMLQLAERPQQRWILGLNGKRRATSIGWDELWRVISDLDPNKVVERQQVLMLSTFGIDPMIGGGQRRVRHLARRLALHADITVLALSGDQPNIQRRTLELGLQQVLVGRSDAHRSAEAEITRVAELPVDDITCGALWESTPAFVAELDQQLRSADLVVCSHPFLAPALEDRLGDIPLVYDCHNAETAFKDTVLPKGKAGDWLRARVHESETFATERAAAVIACTDADIAALRKLAPESTASFAVVQNGVDVAALPLRNPDIQSKCRAELLALVGADVQAKQRIAVFVGSWHPPNLDAAKVILEAAALRKDWLFVLAGSHTISIDATGYDNVYLLSTFAEESLYPILAGADAALNPMISGGGSNLKLYDYLAVGVPVVTTRIGARGLGPGPEPSSESLVFTCEPNAAGLSATLHTLPTDGPAESQLLGRRFVENNVAWADLGDTWARHVLACVSSQESVPARSEPAPRSAPLLSATPPPAADPVIDVMRRIGEAALNPSSPKETSGMEPSLRENLRRMQANRNAGQQLPEGARMRGLKQLAVRAGKFITNEQVTFNDATADAVTTLSRQVQELTAQVEELTTKNEQRPPR